MRAHFEVVAGFGLVVLGLIGLVLPIMPGWIFLIPGLVLLARHFHWARRFLTLVRIKYRSITKREPPP